MRAVNNMIEFKQIIGRGTRLFEDKFYFTIVDFVGASNNSGANGAASGHARVYSWNGSAWTQRGSDLDGEAASDGFGDSAAINSDGNIVAVGAIAITFEFLIPSFITFFLSFSQSNVSDRSTLRYSSPLFSSKISIESFGRIPLLHKEPSNDSYEPRSLASSVDASIA